MTEPFYEFTILDKAHRFDFVSIGEQIINKTIIFHQTHHTGIYSLTLADVTENQEFDVYNVSDNGDMKKVLSTVLRTITAFLESYPNAKVVFSGSTPSRTRLYQIAITHELSNFQTRFLIEGYTHEKGFELFTKNKSYDGFAISVKNP